MQPVAAASLLDLWEGARSEAPGERALRLLALAEPGLPAQELEAWSVGQRDRALLALRDRVFGPVLTALAPCPQCESTLELEFAVPDILVDAQPQPQGPQKVAVGDYVVTFRSPTAGDLGGLPDDEDEAVRRLLARCVLHACRGDRREPPDELPDEVHEAVAAAMAAADPQADVELSLSCPDCAAQWRATFDIVEFLWIELAAWARGVLREIAALAHAYGWSERDSLAMSAWRRRHYLELAGA